MKNHILIKLCAVFAALGVATSAHGITIVPTFDSSITGATNAADMTNAINLAISVMQSNFVDNIIVHVTFVSDESVGLGQSATYGTSYPYLQFITALRSHAASPMAINAISKLPISVTDPVIGGTSIYLTTPQAYLLGLDTPADLDSTVSCKMSLMNFTRPGLDPDKYDLTQVLEHELDEVLGISSGLPNGTNLIHPADLFRYTINLVRTYTAIGDDAYFSPDSTNLLARYNMDPGGDLGDWSSVSNNWSPVSGVGSFPQVQDAFSSPGVIHDLGPAEIAAVNVVGWAIPAAVVSPSPALKIVSTSAKHFTLSWTNTATGFVLQERTGLTGTNWTFSSTGTTNPAVITSTNVTKFYRLYKPGSTGQAPAHNVAITPAPHGPYTITTRRLLPSTP